MGWGYGRERRGEGEAGLGGRVGGCYYSRMQEPVVRRFGRGSFFLWVSDWDVFIAK